jgi:hypothetical protein
MNIRIPVQGELFDAIVIQHHTSSCGRIRDGVAFYLHDNIKSVQPAGGVLDFYAFEEAYFALKRARDASHVQSGGDDHG